MHKKLTPTTNKQKDSYNDLIQTRKKSMQKLNKLSEKSFDWLNENRRDDEFDTFIIKIERAIKKKRY